VPIPEDSGATPTDPASAPGQTILGRFRVEKILGHGGMGEVLLAHDTLLNRRVALKRLRSEGGESAESTGRRSAILKEARRVSQLSDRRIAAIYDVLDLGNDVLIVMEYVDGSTLRERMSAPLPVGDFWDLATQCVEAVAVAHAHGVIHADIKPENLMLTRDGQVKILDFGIARRAEAQGGSPAPGVTTATTTESRAAVIAGTPRYMAPEAHYGGRIDTRTDIFSLGAVFYELLTARSPFAGPTYEVVLDRVMNTTPEPASDVNRSVGPRLAAVIARMMAKDPAQRYASCGDVMRDLVETRRLGAAASPAVAAAPATDARSRRATPWPAVATAMILAVAGAAWILWRGSFGSSLPAERNLAVLAPATPGASEDFSAFALGAIDMLASRLRKHQDRGGFQLASFTESIGEKLASADDARKVQGVNLVLQTSFEQRTDAFHARLDLWDAARGRKIASRTVDASVSQPFAFLDRVHGDAVRMLRLPGSGKDAATACGVRGAGTLRYLLQGLGRYRSATTLEQARRAADDLELACNTEPEAAMPRAWLSAAQLKYFKLGSDRAWLERAEASARAASDRDSSRAETWWSLAEVLAQKNDKEGALAAYRRARDADPTDDWVALRLARTYAQLGQPEKERETYLATIAGRPHCWQPYWWLATWYYRQGRMDDAIGAYRDMIRRAPDLYRGYGSLGGILVLQGEYDRAIDTLKISIALRPSVVGFENLGTAYFNSGRLEQAIEAYNQSFQFGFADYRLWSNLGDAYYWLRGRSDQAAEAYAQAVRMGREESSRQGHGGKTFDVMIPANLSTVFPKIGQPDSARAYLQRALRADSTNALVQYCAALTCWQLGDRRRAVAWLERAVQNGYPAAWLRDSPVFVEWREVEAFRALIAGAGPRTPRTANPGKGGRT
jgi:tetratricopeptide (TPR) repeat protein/predicted Ser/Thr protein kinase